jgi:transposase-like protein
MNRLNGYLPFDLDRDATAADLIADADRVKCPLDCAKGVSFAGRRGKLHRFVCRECGLEFTVVTEPYRPRGGSLS